ncbi:hypothetical protein [Streptomyces scopuliridis]|uniref:hypothetical protein n=1 Tax=Streptomyces scopuliridis TaxID=452529 RepID=UPI0036938DEC
MTQYTAVQDDQAKGNVDIVLTAMRELFADKDLTAKVGRRPYGAFLRRQRRPTPALPPPARIAPENGDLLCRSTKKPRARPWMNYSTSGT